MFHMLYKTNYIWKYGNLVAVCYRKCIEHVTSNLVDSKKGHVQACAATTSITNMSELERLIFHALHHQNRQKAGGEDVPLNVMPL